MAFMQSAQSTSLKARGMPTVTVEDAPDEDEPTPNEEQEEFAPGNDADYFVEEDEDGRFFGGGLTKEQKDILSIFEGAGGEGTIGDVGDYCPWDAANSEAD
jgi:beta-catenin-like protein 1